MAALGHPSVGLGFVNEYRAEKATEALHTQIRHESEALRDGSATTVDVTDLVPGDVVTLNRGEVVPADLMAAVGVGPGMRRVRADR